MQSLISTSQKSINMESNRPHPSSSLSSPLPSSKPVVIPSRSRRSHDNYRPSRERHPGVPPAVAALLAVTAIPRPRGRKHPRRKPVEIVCTPPENDLLFTDVEDSSPEDSWRHSSRATLEFLLSPPEEDDCFDDTSIRRAFSDTRLSERSSSADSVPSLETDNESTFSESSSYSASRRRASLDYRSRIIASPPEECDLDHPLLARPIEKKPAAAQQIEATFAFDNAISRVSQRLNLKSNLTASLRVLKSAAKSFSSLTDRTAAVMQPDDYLTRSILSISPTYRDERRPAPTTGVPTPAVRRYFNPWATTYDDSHCTGAIQMQTYHSSSRSKKSHRNKVVIVEDIDSVSGSRQREVRENGDFLRVIVLEMNMRREGKLSDTAQGRARLVLPPRQPTKIRPEPAAGRWEARVCIYDE